LHSPARRIPQRARYFYGAADDHGDAAILFVRILARLRNLPPAKEGSGDGY